MSAIAILVGFVVCWYFSKHLFAFLARPVSQFLPPGQKLVYTTLPSAFMLYMKVALLGGIFLASPVVIYHLWRFIAPGLYQREKRYALPFIFFSTAFFLGGAAFGYYWMFPVACKFLIEIGSDFQPMITIDQYFSLISKILLWVGLVFELPILIFFLARFGLVTHTMLLKYFKYAFIGIFVLSAVVTPTGDMMTQTLFALPVIGLYLLGILVAWLFGKKRVDDGDSAQAASETSQSE